MPLETKSKTKWVLVKSKSVQEGDEVRISDTCQFVVFTPGKHNEFRPTIRRYPDAFVERWEALSSNGWILMPDIVEVKITYLVSVY